MSLCKLCICTCNIDTLQAHIIISSYAHLFVHTHTYLNTHTYLFVHTCIPIWAHTCMHMMYTWCLYTNLLKCGKRNLFCYSQDLLSLQLMLNYLTRSGNTHYGVVYDVLPLNTAYAYRAYEIFPRYFLVIQKLSLQNCYKVLKKWKELNLLTSIFKIPKSILSRLCC